MNLKSIAEELGISASTVSRVVNGKKNFSVSPELREKILARASSSGFTPNPIYQAMRQKENRQIAILLPNLLHVSIGSEIATGVDRLCDELQKYGFSFHSLNHILAYQKTFQLPAWKVAEVLTVDVRRVELIAELDGSGVPYVSLNGVAGPNGSAVVTDDYANMMLVLNHLRELGHRRIAFLNFYRSQDQFVFTLEDHHYSVRQRLAAYLDFCRETGWEPLAESSRCDLPVPVVVEAGLKRNCTAFACYSFSQAVEALHLLKKRNLLTPRDVSVTAFNNPELAAFVDPPITCVEIPVEEMGRKGAELLLRKYDDPAYARGETFTFKGKLVVRESTGPCNIQNPNQ